MLNLELIGNKISKLRKHKGLKQAELADKLYVTHQAVSKWENGKSIPSIEILYELTTLFDVTIDYLLHNSEIEENDYTQLFHQLPRTAVLSRYLQSENVNADFKKIFYLLNTKERSLVINQIITKTVMIKIEVIWSYLNNNERLYLLGIILSNKYNYDLKPIYHLLSDEERMICSRHVENGTYKYHLPNRVYIRSWL